MLGIILELCVLQRLYVKEKKWEINRKRRKKELEKPLKQDFLDCSL